MYYIKTPYKYVNEQGILEKAGNYISEIGKNPLIIKGKTAGESVGNAFYENLKANNVNTENSFVFSGFPSNNQFEFYAKKAKETNADVIIGIGGGKVLDTAKAAGDIAKIPVITIPTIAATCAAWASISIEYDDNGAFVQVRQNHNSATLVLADAKVIFNARILKSLNYLASFR